MTSIFTSRLLVSQFIDEAVQGIFSDTRYVQYMLEVERALAEAEGLVGVIPPDAAERISGGIATFSPDYADLRKGVEDSSVPVIELVRQLRAHIGGDEATYVHWGATTQDIMDTALVLQVRDTLGLISGLLLTTIKNLAELADSHRLTLMAGRTHSQQAVPIPFGLKVTGWLAPLLRHYQRLQALKERLLVLQFGGAAGTLAPLGGQGIAVEAELARRLDLRVPLMPWHTQRDNLAELGGWLALVTGSLGKMGQDIILLTQTEVGEIRETTDPMRGGSSTMPQKSNPITSELIVAAARHNASLLSSMHQALLQEHERATHGWHLEWITLPQMLMVTAAAARKAAFLTESLEVRADRMQENIRRSNGLIYAEAISFALSGLMPRAEAQRIVKESCAVTVETSRNLFDVLKEKLGDTATIDRAQFEGDKIYLGSSQAFIDRVLVEADTI